MQRLGGFRQEIRERVLGKEAQGCRNRGGGRGGIQTRSQRKDAIFASPQSY